MISIFTTLEIYFLISVYKARQLLEISVFKIPRQVANCWKSPYRIEDLKRLPGGTLADV